MNKSVNRGSGTDEAPGQALEYKVGYGHPPLKTRFQKGFSGNPKGRPKKDRKGFATQVADFMLETVNIGGTKRTWLAVLIARLKKSALDGDPQAVDYLFALEGSGVITSRGRRLAESELTQLLEADARQRADELIQDSIRERESPQKLYSIKDIFGRVRTGDYEWKNSNTANS